MPKSLEIAEACDRVGRQLQAEYGNEPIPVQVLIDAVVAECGCSKGSVLPSDRCYNRTNDGIKFENSPMFLYVGRGLYRYVGLNYPYTGPLVHKPKLKGEPERIVGEWIDGKLHYSASETETVASPVAQAPGVVDPARTPGAYATGLAIDE